MSFFPQLMDRVICKSYIFEMSYISKKLIITFIYKDVNIYVYIVLIFRLKHMFLSKQQGKITAGFVLFLYGVIIVFFTIFSN